SEDFILRGERQPGIFKSIGDGECKKSFQYIIVRINVAYVISQSCREPLLRNLVQKKITQVRINEQQGYSSRNVEKIFSFVQQLWHQYVQVYVHKRHLRNNVRE